MMPRRAYLVLVLLLLAPHAAADVELGFGAATVTLRTGHTRDCFPSEAACAFAASDAPTVSDRTYFVNTRLELVVGARPATVVPGTAVDDAEHRVRLERAAVEAPITSTLAATYHSLLPDDAVVYDHLRLSGSRVAFRYLGPAGFTDPGGLNPHVKWKDDATAWVVANHTHVFIPQDLMRVESSQDVFTNATDPLRCRYGLERSTYATVNRTSCPTTREANLVQGTWNATTPAVVWGVRAEGADVGVSGNGTATRRVAGGASGAGAGPSGVPAHAPLVPSDRLAPVPHPPLSAAPPGGVGSAGAGEGNGGPARGPPVASASAAVPVPAPALPVATLAATAAMATALALAVWTLYFRGRVRGEGPAALLRCPTRRKILEVVRANPGLTAADLVRRVGAKHNTVLYHVRLLDKGQLLTIVRNEGPRSFLRIHPTQAAPRGPARDAALVLNAPAARAVAARLLENPRHGLTVGALATLTGLGAGGIRYHLAAMERRHLVVADQTVGRVAFRIVDEARDGVGLALALTAGQAPSPTDSMGAVTAAASDGSPA